MGLAKQCGVLAEQLIRFAGVFQREEVSDPRAGSGTEQVAVLCLEHLIVAESQLPVSMERPFQLHVVRPEQPYRVGAEWYCTRHDLGVKTSFHRLLLGLE